MTTEPCLSIEELEQLAALPAGDPRRQHLERCPRCRMLLHSYQAFVKEPEAGPAARGSDLDARLATALDREIFGRAAVPAAAAECEEVSLPGRRGLGWLRDAFRGRPVLRIAAISAAVLLIVLGVREAGQLRPQGTGEIVLRGAGPAETDALSAQVRLLPQGAWDFSWSPVADADAYRIVLYDKDRIERTQLEAVGGSASLTVARADLPAPVGGESVLFWRVIAFERGDEIGRSRLQLLPLR